MGELAFAQHALAGIMSAKHRRLVIGIIHGASGSFDINSKGRLGSDWVVLQNRPQMDLGMSAMIEDSIVEGITIEDWDVSIGCCTDAGEVHAFGTSIQPRRRMVGTFTGQPLNYSKECSTYYLEYKTFNASRSHCPYFP